MDCLSLSLPSGWLGKMLLRRVGSRVLLLEDEYYQIVSNPTRRRILHSLGSGEKSFSDLMRSVSMDPEHDTGPFLFHVHKLEEMGLVASKNGCYSLAGKGRQVSENISFVGSKLRGVEEVSVKGTEPTTG
jgi:predicted transcriptional regulator